MPESNAQDGPFFLIHVHSTYSLIFIATCMANPRSETFLPPWLVSELVPFYPCSLPSGDNISLLVYDLEVGRMKQVPGLEGEERECLVELDAKPRSVFPYLLVHLLIFVLIEGFPSTCLALTISALSVLLPTGLLWASAFY